MAYASLSDLKAYVSVTDTTDDALLTDFLSAAEKVIDAFTRRRFEASADSTRYFHALDDVQGRTLHLDKDLCAITSITNGDGVAVTAGQYTTLPKAETPYYALKLLASSGVAWTYDDDPEDAITIVGKWAFSTSAPADVKHATVRLAAFLYRQRDNSDAMAERPFMSADGVLLLPSRLPMDVQELLMPYRKVL